MRTIEVFLLEKMMAKSGIIIVLWNQKEYQLQQVTGRYTQETYTRF